MQGIFTGFKALPESGASEVVLWQILGLKQRPANKKEVEQAYKSQVKLVHPDAPGGNHERFILLQEAYMQALNFYK